VNTFFIPDMTQTYMSISVAANAIQDQAGNQNDLPSNVLTWTFDGHRPNVTIHGIDYGAISNQETLILTFIISETVVVFDIEDVHVDGGGVLSNFTGSDSMYQAMFTPSGDGEKIIRVMENIFEDIAGNSNTASNVLKYTYDSTVPTMTITESSNRNSGFTSNDNTLDLTFEASEDIKNFKSEDISVVSGTITNFVPVNNHTFTCTLTPSFNDEVSTLSVKVSSESFQDVAGSTNDEDTDTFEWTHDPLPPTMTIKADEGNSGFTSSDANLSLTFTLNEDVEEFTVSDINATGGLISNFQASSTSYTATFTPVGLEGMKTIFVGVNKFRDLAGGFNVVPSNMFMWLHDANVPTMTISCSQGESGFYSSDASIDLIFTSSEDTVTFTKDDIRVEGDGEISSFSELNARIYTATFTPSNGNGEKEIHVNAGWYEDAASNTNEASNTFVWNYDATRPTIIISCPEIENVNYVYNSATLTFKFEFSETDTNFGSISDITVSGGTVSQISSSEYVFTSSGDGLKSISVAEGEFQDLAANTNLPSNIVEWM